MTKLSRRAVAAAVAAVALGAGTATWGAAAASAAPAPAPVPVCTASQLNVWVSPDSANGTAGTTYYNLDITNVSGRPCQLRGWPAVVATNSRGRQFGAPARAVGHGPVAAVTIFPDATAHANLGYVDAALSRSCKPATATALSVGLPGVRGARHAFFPLQICTRRGGNLTIGNIQPGA